MFYRKDGDIIFENDENFENKKKPLKNTENEDTKSCDCNIWKISVLILIIIILIGLGFVEYKWKPIRGMINKKPEDSKMVSDVVENVVENVSSTV